MEPILVRAASLDSEERFQFITFDEDTGALNRVGPPINETILRRAMRLLGAAEEVIDATIEQARHSPIIDLG